MMPQFYSALPVFIKLITAADPTMCTRSQLQHWENVRAAVASDPLTFRLIDTKVACARKCLGIFPLPIEVA